MRIAHKTQLQNSFGGVPSSAKKGKRVHISEDVPHHAHNIGEGVLSLIEKHGGTAVENRDVTELESGAKELELAISSDDIPLALEDEGLKKLLDNFDNLEKHYKAKLTFWANLMTFGLAVLTSSRFDAHKFHSLLEAIAKRSEANRNKAIEERNIAVQKKHIESIEKLKNTKRNVHVS